MLTNKLDPSAAKYQVMPDLTEDEYQALKSDIAIRGVMVPVQKDEYGNIIDGHHRVKICEEIGITDYPSLICIGKSDEQKRSLARALNYKRRHLSAEQRRTVIAEELKDSPERSNRQIAAEYSTSHVTVGKVRDELVSTGQIDQLDRTIGADGKSRPVTRSLPSPAIFTTTAKDEHKAVALIDTLHGSAVPNGIAPLASVQKAQKDAIRSEKAAEREEDHRERAEKIETVPVDDRYRLICSDVRKLSTEIEAGSVDYIITDPAYPEEFLPLFEDLSKFAAYALKPGGSLLAMCGQSYLPTVYDLLGRHLTYHWTLSYGTPGGQAVQIFPRKVQCFWKPILWYVKDTHKGDWHSDVLKSAVNDNDKRFHEWGQSESGFTALIEGFTKPGDVICDPFLGGGTTAVVAIQTGRRFVGADIEQSSIDTTQKRILTLRK